MSGVVLDLPALRRWWTAAHATQRYPRIVARTNGLYSTENYAVPWWSLPDDVIVYFPWRGLLRDLEA